MKCGVILVLLYRCVQGFFPKPIIIKALRSELERLDGMEQLKKASCQLAQARQDDQDALEAASANGWELPDLPLRSIHDFLPKDHGVANPK